MAKLIFLALSILLPVALLHPVDPYVENDDGAQLEDESANATFLARNGIEVSQLLSRYKFNTIESGNVDAAHAKPCSSPPNLKSSKNGLTNPRLRWYKNNDGTYIIPIFFVDQYTPQERDLLYAAMIEIQDTTCIRFSIFSDERQLRGYDYVGVTKTSQGCFAYMGRLGQGRQQLNLEPGAPGQGTCMHKGVAVHELIHSVGFHHMQNTPERDDFVTIVWDNIPSDRNTRFQFEKLSSQEASSYGAPYDYGSIMHYGRKDFSRNGGDTIVSKQPGQRFGQRDRISQWDAWKINRMYGCN